MKKYYSTITKYYFDGHVSCAFYESKNLDNCPTSTKIEKADYNLYIDWFGSFEDVEKYLKRLKDTFCLNFVS